MAYNYMHLISKGIVLYTSRPTIVFDCLDCEEKALESLHVASFLLIVFPPTEPTHANCSLKTHKTATLHNVSKARIRDQEQEKI